MADEVQKLPEGLHSVTPYLIVEDVAKLMEFLEHVFDAEEIECMPGPNGKIFHAEVRIGDSVIMMGGSRDQWTPMPGSIYLYVNDTDAAYNRALREGATSLMEPADQFYGDRNAGVKDPCGNIWWIATHQEDVSHEELKRRASAHAN